jgi:hypothetical protein
VTVPFVEIAASEFVIVGLLSEQRVDHDKDAVRNRDDSALRPSARSSARTT